MKKKSEHYYYQSRYKTLKERIISFINNFKGKLLESISKSKTISKRVEIWETFGLSKKIWIGDHNLYAEDLYHDQGNYYTDIILKSVNFMEVIDIDNFDIFRKKVVEKFGSLKTSFSYNPKEEIKKKLSGIENNFDTISTGGLFYIDYNKIRKKENDLLDTIQCTYIKTNESYFILTFEVNLSKKGQDIFKEIIQQKDMSLTRPNYNSFFRILTRKRFYASESFSYSLKCNSIRNLISDLNNQVKKNVTRYFDGYFYNSNIFKVAPSIELYEVDNVEEFKKDQRLLSNFYDDFGKYYSLSDNLVEIYLSNQFDEKRELIQIVKQKGHGNKKNRNNDLTNYDNLESHYLSQGLVFPCVFSAILEEQNYKLNLIKRDVYDQIKIPKANRMYSYLIFWKSNKRYIKSKRGLIQILMTLKRFENEFNDYKLQFYIRDGSLKGFVARNTRDNKESDLLTDILENLKYKIKNLDDKTKSLNEIFKPLEEFNSYKTNLYLQIFSICITILAFIFTFEKTKEFALVIFHKLVK